MKIYRWYLIVVLTAVLGLSCGTDDAPEETGTLVLYKIDYTTNEFEGGVAFTPPQIPTPLLSEIPLSVETSLPNMNGDGAVRIIFQPSLLQIFRAALTTDGEAQIFFPLFTDPEGFFRLDTPIAMPAGLEVQSVEGDHSQVDLAPLWNAIADLGLTEGVLNDNTIFALYLYQPSSNPAHSANWDWILMMYDQL